MLDDPSVDLVHVVLPHHLHAAVSTSALEAGKHVICEKPAAISLAEFDGVTAAAAAAGRRFFVVMNQLYSPLARRVRELLDAGAIGRPFLSVENAFSKHDHFYRDPDSWRTRLAAAGGGVLIDGGYHMVYRQLYCLAGHGEPAWVVADVAQLAVDPHGRTAEDFGEDFVSITVGFDGPLRVCWSHAWTLAADVARARQSFVAGTKATLELTDDADETLVLRSPDGDRPIEIAERPRTGADTTRACLLDFFECLAGDRRPERASLQAARTALAVILAAYESGQTGRRVPLR